MEQELREKIKYLMDWQEFKPETFGFMRQEETIKGFEKLIAEVKEAEGRAVAEEFKEAWLSGDWNDLGVDQWVGNVLSARYGTKEKE